MSKKKKEKDNHLAIFLKNRRIEAELSQKDVADGLGYSSAQFISNWERGLSSPPMDSLKKLTEILNIKPKELVEVMLQETKKNLEKSLDVHQIKRHKNIKRTARSK